VNTQIEFDLGLTVGKSESAMGKSGWKTRFLGLEGQGSISQEAPDEEKADADPQAPLTIGSRTSHRGAEDFHRAFPEAAVLPDMRSAWITLGSTSRISRFMSRGALRRAG
jgi:hypothetical protein